MTFPQSCCNPGPTCTVDGVYTIGCEDQITIFVRDQLLIIAAIGIAFIVGEVSANDLSMVCMCVCVCVRVHVYVYVCVCARLLTTPSNFRLLWCLWRSVCSAAPTLIKTAITRPPSHAHRHTHLPTNNQHPAYDIM